jgi:hypothetical protein
MKIINILKMLSSDRNINYKILTQLDDRSLLNVCSTNKKAYYMCQDERFWEQLIENQDKMVKYITDYKSNN